MEQYECPIGPCPCGRNIYSIKAGELRCGLMPVIDHNEWPTRNIQAEQEPLNVRASIANALTSIEEAIDFLQEAQQSVESTPRICTERFVVWDDGRADRRYGAIVEWLGTWPEHTDNGDGRVARLLDGLIMYGGYRPWMANITSIVSETRVDGRVWGMGSLGRGASNVSLVTVRVTERLDGGALAEHDRQFYLATHAQGDDVSSDTADTLDGLWAQ